MTKAITYDFRQIYTIADVLEQALSDDEAPSQRFPCLLLHNLLQHPLQILHIVMFIPANRAPANLQSLPDRIIARLICHDNIAPLAERRDDTGNRREGVGVHNACLRAQMRRNVRLGLHVHILRAVELRGSAGPDAIGAQGLDRLLFDLLVGHEVVVVVGCEIRDGAAVGELGFRPRASTCCQPMYHTHTDTLKVTYPTITGSFSITVSSKFVNGATSGSGVHSSTKSSISYFPSATSLPSPPPLKLPLTSSDNVTKFCLCVE